MDRSIASQYVRENFQPSDRLAILLLDKRNNTVIQRVASAEQIAAPEFQAWLRHKNAQHYDVYISMNTLRPGATGRTKADIESVRHVYLDFDDNGTEAVERLHKRSDLPAPNYRLSSSPGKWQVVWKVDGFTPDEAERLQRELARQTGADLAATDCARVMRLPGFYNHKYEAPHFVSAEGVGDRVHRPADFPTPEREPQTPSRSPRAQQPSGGLTQSEKDWAFAKRSLANGEPQYLVVAAIATRRRCDKHNPQYYAEITVRKAAQSLDAETSEREARSPEPPR